MYEVRIRQTANQNFNTQINKHGFNFNLRSFRGLMYVTVDVDGVNAVTGFRVVHNAEILPASVARTVGGNFRFICQDSEYPSFDKLDGVACRLLFYEKGE